MASVSFTAFPEVKFPDGEGIPKNPPVSIGATLITFLQFHSIIIATQEPECLNLKW